MNELSMAKSLMGTQKVNPGQTTTAYGYATSESIDGLVMVDMGGDTVSPDDDQSIECETTFKVYEGDEVLVSLIGADGSGKTPIVVGVVGRGDEEEKKANALRQRAEELANDIIESADETYQKAIGNSITIMEAGYLSKSAFGTYAEEINTKIEQTAKEIRESFNYEELVSSIDDMEQYLNVLSGEIRRGFIDINGEKIFGIVVSSRNVFSAAGGTYTPTGETNVYYEIDTGECFGFYTATGWQFWKGNQKLGWFDIETGQLHVEKINIESELVMGDWRLINTGKVWGIKYIGA